MVECHSGAMAELVPVDPDVEAYADAFLVQWSAYGFDLSFGREYLPDQGLTNAAFTVHMSPQLALLLSRTLAERMEAYERNVGNLPVPVSSEAGTEKHHQELERAGELFQGWRGLRFISSRGRGHDC